MEWAKRVFYAALMLTILLGAFVQTSNRATAQDTTPPDSPPPRQTTLVVPYTENEWWLISWETNEISCRVLTDHEGLPTDDEVLSSCGADLQALWVNTPPCNLKGKEGVTSCNGLYLFLAATQPRERQVLVDLPLPTVWVNLEGCSPQPPENLCPVLPTLLLTGDEPLPNERILRVNGLFAGVPFSCDGPECRIPLGPTPLAGVTVEFWVDSSFGDSSERFTAQVRVIDTGVQAAPGSGGWYVDVISSQWQGAPIASCARTWEAFPPVGGPPFWLSTPERNELMSSADPYFYLAGRLIVQGLVDASACPTGGLLPNGYANACGLETSRGLVTLWQNQFDTEMITAARETGVPAQLMKNLFAQESQFWPGVFRVPWEFGLGQITDNGTDTILLWNDTFFAQFCPLVLSSEACAGGYLGLQPEDQAILRGALALQAKSDCPTCLTGIDLRQVRFSVQLFANTLQANCAQVDQTIFTATQETAGSVANYEDLWRLTVANYHAGNGCVSYAIHQAWAATASLTWDEVKTRFTEPCQGVVPYVDKITQ